MEAKNILLLLCVFAAITFCVAERSELSYKNEFTKFMQKFNKHYPSQFEMQERFNIFRRNLARADFHNSERHTFTLGINQFSDLTSEEFKITRLGFKASDAPRNVHLAPKNDFALPTSVDWRNSSAVTDIKDQGDCGSCWSFSTTGTIEGFHAIHTKKLVSLSEQNIIDCTWDEPYNNTGCDGGDMRTALAYVIANNGVDTEDSYPYADYYGGDQETCMFTVANIGASIKAVYDVPTGNETDLAYAVFNCPVSIAIDASHDSFQNYEGGVYYEPDCSNNVKDLDHGVLVVGFGTWDGVEYWIVKNSWGPTWGMEGYILMSRNADNQCGIATYATYPTA